MSLLPLNFDIALERFSQPIVGYETTGQYLDGLWKKTKGTERIIECPVFIASPEKLEILTKGEITDGGIVIHTTETLYVQNPLETTVQNKQTFIKYDGLIYRVVSKAPHAANTGFNTYIATRYVEHGSDS